MNRRRFVCMLLLGLAALAAPLPALAEFGAREQAELRERFRNATPAERRALRREFRARFRRATPEERLQMRDFVRDNRVLGDEASGSDPFGGEPPRSLREVVETYQAASPEEQQEIKRRLGQHMRDLPPAQRRRAMRQLRHEFKQGTQDQLRSLEGDLGGLSAAEKRRVRERVRSLPADERRALMQRLGRYRSLPADEQQALRDKLGSYRALPEDEQARLRRNAERFRDMPEGDRARLREALRELRELPADEREALVEELLAD
jgi:hypothetical protein